MGRDTVDNQSAAIKTGFMQECAGVGTVYLYDVFMLLLVLDDQLSNGLLQLEVFFIAFAFEQGVDFDRSIATGFEQGSNEAFDYRIVALVPE